MTNTLHPMARKHSTRLTPDQVREIRTAYSEKLFTQVQLSALYNVTQVSISDIILRHTWAHI